MCIGPKIKCKHRMFQICIYVYYAMLSTIQYMYMKVSGVSTYRPLIKNILLIKFPAPNSNTLFERNVVVNGVIVLLA